MSHFSLFLGLVVFTIYVRHCQSKGCLLFYSLAWQCFHIWLTCYSHCARGFCSHLPFPSPVLLTSSKSKGFRHSSIAPFVYTPCGGTGLHGAPLPPSSVVLSPCTSALGCRDLTSLS